MFRNWKHSVEVLLLVQDQLVWEISGGKNLPEQSTYPSFSWIWHAIVQPGRNEIATLHNIGSDCDFLSFDKVI